MNSHTSVFGHHSRSDRNPESSNNTTMFPSTSDIPPCLGRAAFTSPTGTPRRPEHHHDGRSLFTDMKPREQYSRTPEHHDNIRSSFTIMKSREQYSRTPEHHDDIRSSFTDRKSREHCSRSSYAQVQPSQSLGQQIGRGSQMQSYQSPFEPFVEIRENDRPTGTNRPFNLSPDMEFDDMEVYSCPFTEPEGRDNKKPAVKVPVTATDSLNFKEIKPRPLQKNRSQQINTPPLVRPNGRILSSNKIEPSDQTFILTNANTVPKFKKTLAKYKNIPSRITNTKSSVQKTKDDNDIIQGDFTHHRRITFIEASTERGYKKSLDDNFEIDDVFDGNKFDEKMTLKIGMNVTKTISVEDSSVSNLLSKSSDGLVVEIQENTLPQVLTKQQEINSSINDSNFKQLSELSENLFVKTQESEIVKNHDCVQNRVNKIDDQNQSKVENPPYQQNVMNFKSDESTYNQQSDMSQNLFVKTQESVIIFKNDPMMNAINDNNLSEELSIPPYQKPLENNDSPDFDVDDLFSLKDESLKDSLAALKGKSDNFENSMIPYGGDGNCEGFSINNNRTENVNFTMNNLTSEEENKLMENSSHVQKNEMKQTTNGELSDLTFEEEIKLIENSSHVENIETKQITDGELSVNKNVNEKSYNAPPVKSIYFQAPNQKENSKPEFHRMTAKDNKMNKENCHRIANRVNPGQVKDGVGVGRKPLTPFEVNIQIEKGNLVTKSFSKNSSLKQSTLFNCRKFLPELKNTQDCHDSEPKLSTQQVEVPQVEKFKKPLPPAKKAKVKTSPKVNNVKNSEKSPTAISLADQSGPRSSSDGKEFLLSCTPMQEIRQRCDPSKLVQSSLIKNEPVKRSIISASKQNKSKKPRFVPPIAASHLTSQSTALQNHTITVIDEVSANEVLQRVHTDELTKVVTTVTFKEGYTLLNKPEDQKKNSRCSPSGVMFMILWGTGKSGYYWLPRLDHSAVPPPVVKLVDTLMTKSARNICFEAQAVYMLLMDEMKYKDISGWNAYDPLIGCWLLDPDNPPKDFQETCAKLEMDRTLLLVNPQANTKNQACDLLPVLDVAMNVLQNRLVNASLWTVFSDMETKLISILAVMENSSILVDVEKLHRTAKLMDKKLKKLESEAHELAGQRFQLGSPQQLREILFGKLKLDEKFNLKTKLTDHGEKSTAETVLEQLKAYHPLPKIVLEYRRLQKVKSTYVDGLIQNLKGNQTIGTSWEQVSAATGRITSKNPNLQAFPKCPINVQDGETIHPREVFKAREGCSFLAADFQQIEFRVFAHFTQDKSLLQAFREGGDIFQRLAERWLGGKGEEEREKTKRIVYSVMYGAGANKLSEYLRVEPAEAYKIIDNFVVRFPSLRSLPRTVISECRARGFVVTLSGRRRLFPHIRSPNGKLRSYSERQAMNFLIQGSAADICKAAMLDCEAELRSQGLRAKLLLMIHDELIWEVDDRDLGQTAKTVKAAMEHRWNERLSLLVPVPVCISTGSTLADMQPLEE